jgi:hypothetical protein
MSGYIYHTREVRDLAWACFSPPLMHTHGLAEPDQNIANCGLHLSSARQQWLGQLDRQPESLHRHLSTLHNKRLGLYFESLWHFFLQHDPQVDLIAHNLAVRTPEKTIGEFDCLYYCHQREQHIHLELAVKYYLSQRGQTTHEPASQLSEWLGPNNKDNLERKVSHLTRHQIQLGKHPASQPALQQLGIEELSKEIEIKGYLFQSQSDPLPAPHGYNHQRHLCHWVTIDTLVPFLRDLDCSHYSILDKTHWLAGAQLDACRAVAMPTQSLVDQLLTWFLSDSRPQLIVAFGAEDIEQERFFVTGPDWPDPSS